MKWEGRDRVRARKGKESLERHVADESLNEPQVKSGWGWADQMLSTVALFPSQSASPAGCSTHFRHQGVTETWKYRITDKLSWGLAVLWKFTTQAVGESQTSPSHQLFKWFFNFSLSSPKVWITACYCIGPGSHPVRHTIVIPLTVTLFLFLSVPGKWMEQVNVGLFSVATSIWWNQSTQEASNKGGNWL